MDSGCQWKRNRTYHTYGSSSFRFSSRLLKIDVWNSPKHDRECCHFVFSSLCQWRHKHDRQRCFVPSSTKRQSDLPLVAILHDSVLNGVQGGKIRTILWIWCVQAKNWENRWYWQITRIHRKAIVAHCRINDIRTKDPKDVSKTMVKSLKGILKDRPNLKVIVSKIPPVKDPNLQAKSFSTHLFFLNWWKIQISHLWLMKTYTSLHWRTPSILIWRGRLSSRGILAAIFIICSGKGRGKSPGVIFSNRINYIHSNVEIHLDGKAVGSHGCGCNYWIHMNRLERLSRQQLYLNL